MGGELLDEDSADKKDISDREEFKNNNEIDIKDS